jgi:hypothetical protein
MLEEQATIVPNLLGERIARGLVFRQAIVLETSAVAVKPD